MRLFIVRHGDAVVPAGGHERSLTQRGIADAGAAGRLLAEEVLDAIYTSPLLRTRQTTDHLLEAVGQAGTTALTAEVAEELVPPSDGQAITALLDRSEAQSVVLVSHMPLVAYLVSWFTSGDYRSYPFGGYPEAGIVALDFDIWGQGMGTLAWYAFPPGYKKATR